MSKSFKIRETEEYYPLSVLFHESGMEIEISDKPPEGMVKMWRLDDEKTGGLIAAVTLQIRDNVYTLGDLAVKEEYQSEGCGKLMQQFVFDEARKMGIKELWGSARVPDYYYRFGWQKMDWETSPQVAVNCHSCDKCGKTCFPAILKIVL